MNYTINCIHSSNNTTHGTCAVKRNWLGLHKKCNFHPIYNNCGKRVEHKRPDKLSEPCKNGSDWIAYKNSMLRYLNILKVWIKLQSEEVELELKANSSNISGSDDPKVILDNIESMLKNSQRIIEIRLQIDILSEQLIDARNCMGKIRKKTRRK